MKARQEDMNQYGPTYTKAPVDWQQCIYCGEAGDITRDHVPPISKASHVIMSERKIYPACANCNAILNNNGLYIDDRAAYLYTRLQTKYKKILKMPHWGQEELDELGYTLRVSIKNSMVIKTYIERRLDYIKCVYNL